MSFESSEDAKHPKTKVILIVLLPLRPFFSPARLQALYIAFFDAESERVKADNPKLKHSQVQNEVSCGCVPAPLVVLCGGGDSFSGLAAMAALAPEPEEPAQSGQRRRCRRRSVKHRSLRVIVFAVRAHGCVSFIH